MRKAYCDKCGKEIKEIKRVDGLINYSALHFMFDKCYDLCKECKKKFNRWLKRS